MKYELAISRMVIAAIASFSFAAFGQSANSPA
jgi:hypothetical protein